MLNVSAIFVLLTAFQADPLTVPVAPKAAPPPIEVKRGHVATFPRIIAGRITDENGQPVSGAMIEWGPDYPHDVAFEQTASADDGTYRLEIQKAGSNYKLGISAAGHCATWRRNLIPGPESAPTEMNVTMSPETTIELTIVSESGTPIPNLEVTPRTPTTGFNSSFSSVQQPEPIPGHHKGTRCNDQGVCRLKQLLPAPDGLQVIAESDTDQQKEFKERNNAAGWLALRIEQDGKWVHELEISREEYFDSRGRIRIVIPNYRNPLREHIYNGTIYGQVTDVDGNPITEYFVTLRHKAEPLAVNNAEGRFEWEKTLDPDRSYQLRVFAKGFAPTPVEITPKITNKAEPFEIKLVPVPSVEFQLVDKQTQKPIADAPVVSGVTKRNGWNYVEWNNLRSYADGHHGLEMVLPLVTDSDGRITVPEGKNQPTLIVLTPGFARTIITPNKRPEPDENGVIRIALEPAATIHATRAANSRIGRDGDQIYLSIESPANFSQMFHSLRLDEQGKCFIDSLAPGKYQIGLSHANGNMSTACWLKMIELKPGQRLELPLGEMTGMRTVSGRATPFTDVSLRPKDDLANGGVNKSELTVIATITDIDGYFELNGLEGGIYDVELGRLTNRNPLFPSVGGLAFNRPLELFLVSDTHIDYITGIVAPPEAAVEKP